MAEEFCVGLEALDVVLLLVEAVFHALGEVVDYLVGELGGVGGGFFSSLDVDVFDLVCPGRVMVYELAVGVLGVGVPLVVHFFLCVEAAFFASAVGCATFARAEAGIASGGLKFVSAKCAIFVVGVVSSHFLFSPFVTTVAPAGDGRGVWPRYVCLILVCFVTFF